MTIDTKKTDGTLIVTLEGRLDTTTAPDLEKTLNDSMDGITQLIFDFKDLSYISSAGLRVLLTSHKTMSQQNGTLVVRNVSDDILDVFEVTGFIAILNVEK